MQVDPYNFPSVEYDRFGDWVYLRADPDDPSGASAGRTPERHAFLYPVAGGDGVVGLDLQDMTAQLEQEGKVTVTLPSGELVRLEHVERLISR